MNFKITTIGCHDPPNDQEQNKNTVTTIEYSQTDCTAAATKKYSSLGLTDEVTTTSTTLYCQQYLSDAP
jgi:hypothetical protein